MNDPSKLYFIKISVLQKLQLRIYKEVYLEEIKKRSEEQIGSKYIVWNSEIINKNKITKKIQRKLREAAHV